jgi:hypothetical protein
MASSAVRRVSRFPPSQGAVAVDRLGEIVSAGFFMKVDLFWASRHYTAMILLYIAGSVALAVFLLNFDGLIRSDRAHRPDKGQDGLLRSVPPWSLWLLLACSFAIAFLAAGRLYGG